MVGVFIPDAMFASDDWRRHDERDAPPLGFPPPGLSSPPQVADDSSSPLFCCCVCPDYAVHVVVVRSYDLLVRRTEVVVVVTELLQLTDSISTTALLRSSSSTAAMLVTKSEIRPLCRCIRLDRSWGSAGSSCNDLATFLAIEGVICAFDVNVVASLVEEDDDILS